MSSDPAQPLTRNVVTILGRPLRSARVMNRTRTPVTTTDYETVLEALTGTRVHLRNTSKPVGGWLRVVPPGGEHWWTFSAFGSTLFSVDLDEAAADAWAKEIGTVEGIDQELFSGQYELIDVQRLRAAAQGTKVLAQALGDVVSDFNQVLAPLDQTRTALAGTAVAVLEDRLHLLGDLVQLIENDLTTDPAPAVDVVLDQAAQALTTFGQQMAYIYWESNQILLNAVALGVNAISANMMAYFQRVGLLPGSTLYQAHAADPDGGVGYARLMLGRYSSTVAGPLPYGIAPIAGDLSQQPIWDAAGAAITHLISVELDKMDVVARKVAEETRTAYDNATNRLNAPSAVVPVMASPAVMVTISP